MADNWDLTQAEREACKTALGSWVTTPITNDLIHLSAMVFVRTQSDSENMKPGEFTVENGIHVFCIADNVQFMCQASYDETEPSESQFVKADSPGAVSKRPA